jgi:pimeloyl-ACP methyl ester carboxylesterase
MSPSIVCWRWVAVRSASSSGGLEWVYLDSGGSGEPLVLVHGFGGDKANWTRLRRHLRGRYRLIIPDLPGFGESESPPQLRYRVQDHVERLRGFLRDLGVERSHMGGNSMGGFIVTLYATKYPIEVASLWLIDSGGVFSATPGELFDAVRSGGPNPMLPQTPAQFRKVLGFAMSKPPYIPGFVLDVLARRVMASVRRHVDGRRPPHPRRQDLHHQRAHRGFMPLAACTACTASRVRETAGGRRALRRFSPSAPTA